jgi:hypothetical protein
LHKGPRSVAAAVSDIPARHKLGVAARGNAPQLPLSDVVPEVFDIAKVNGILTHGPIGKEFTEQSQNLAFLNFTVPDNSYSVVSINIPVLEIIDRFDRAEVGTEIPQRDIAQPRIKRPAAKKTEAKDSR